MYWSPFKLTFPSRLTWIYIYITISSFGWIVKPLMFIWRTQSLSWKWEPPDALLPANVTRCQWYILLLFVSVRGWRTYAKYHKAQNMNNIWILFLQHFNYYTKLLIQRCITKHPFPFVFPRKGRVKLSFTVTFTSRISLDVTKPLFLWQFKSFS